MGFSGCWMIDSGNSFDHTNLRPTPKHFQQYHTGQTCSVSFLPQGEFFDQSCPSAKHVNYLAYPPSNIGLSPLSVRTFPIRPLLANVSQFYYSNLMPGTNQPDQLVNFLLEVQTD